MPNISEIMEVFLSCGHTTIYRKPVPAFGDRLYCLRCDNETIALGSLKVGERRADTATITTRGRTNR